MNRPEAAALLRELAEDPETLIALHVHMEDELIDMRDRCMFVMHANGLVIREKDGSPSDIIRIGTRAAIAMILKATADRLDG